jgi:hypothetical protein
MGTLDHIKDSLSNSFAMFGESIANYVPLIISVLVVLLTGWLFSKLISKTIHRALIAIKFDELTEKIGVDKILSKIMPGLSAAFILSKVFYWMLMLMFFMSAANVLGWEMLTNGIAGFMGYLPTLGIALIIFVIGIFIADLIKNMIYTAANTIGVSGAKAIANIVYYILFIFIAITALNKAGIDTEVITSNIALILGSILLTFALAYGFAARNLVTNMLSSYYGKGKTSGVIEKIYSISIALITAEGREVIPSKILVEEQVAILSEPKEEITD